jgi:hypothetical protein
VDSSAAREGALAHSRANRLKRQLFVFVRGLLDFGVGEAQARVCPCPPVRARVCARACARASACGGGVQLKRFAPKIDAVFTEEPIVQVCVGHLRTAVAAHRWESRSLVTSAPGLG